MVKLCHDLQSENQPAANRSMPRALCPGERYAAKTTMLTMAPKSEISWITGVELGVYFGMVAKGG